MCRLGLVGAVAVLTCALMATSAAAGVTFRPVAYRAFDYSESSHYVVVEYNLENHDHDVSYSTWQFHLMVGSTQHDDGLHPMVLAKYCSQIGCSPSDFKQFVMSVAPGAVIKSVAIFDVPSLPDEATLIVSAGLGGSTHRVSLKRSGSEYMAHADWEKPAKTPARKKH